MKWTNSLLGTLVVLTSFGTLCISNSRILAQNDPSRHRDPSEDRDSRDKLTRAKEEVQRQAEERRRGREPDRDAVRQREENGNSNRNRTKYPERVGEGERNRNRDRDRNPGYRHQPDPKFGWPQHEDWRRHREPYRRPIPGHMSPPRHGYGIYIYRSYPRPYPRPFGVFIGRIPVIIFNHPIYRNCHYISQVVVNLSGHRAQILINGYPYDLDNGRDFLYPGESARITVPDGRQHYLYAAVFVDGDWYETELEYGIQMDLVIPPIE